MTGFFKSLFRGSAQKPLPASKRQGETISDEQLSGLSFPDLVKIIQSLPKTPNFGTTAPILRRLYRIALFDNHVPDEHRKMSLECAEALAVDLQASLADNPEGIIALRHAITQTKELARVGGYGSLVWRLNEYPMSAAQTVPYIMKPEHRDLVPDYLKTLTSESITRVKPALVRQLIVQESYNSHNAVLILHGVVTKGDKAAAALFTSDEYSALLSVPDDYAGGRSVLVRLGILPAVSEAKPFKRLSELKGGISLALKEMLKERLDKAEGDSRLGNLSHDRKIGLLLTLIFLRTELARAMICQIYGEQSAYDVVTLYSDHSVIEQWGRFSEVAKVLKGMAPGTPVDFMLLDAVMTGGGIEAKSEDEYNESREFLALAVHWLNAERVEFLDALRGMLRSNSDAGDHEDALPE